MSTYLIGPFLAFLPARCRKLRFASEVDWPRAAAISGLLEGFVALAALVVWYSIFVTRLAPIVGSPGLLGGYVGLFSLLMHPLTWVIFYFGSEGAVRFLAALVSGECYGTLPLALINWSTRKNEGGLPRKRVPDEVVRGTGAFDLKIASCRVKEHWTYPLTIRYENEFFQVTGKERASSKVARPYVYFLRRLPGNEIIKGLESYDPNATTEEQPGFLKTVSQIRNRAAR